MTEKFQAVIFDMGGVLLRMMDPQPRESLAQRFGTTREFLEQLVFNSPSSIQSEVGEVSETDHWQMVLDHFGQSHLPIMEVYFEFFSGDRVNKDLLDYAINLRPDIKIGLLSNAWANTRKYVSENYGFVHHFDASIFSAEVKVRKPQREIYERMLDQLEVAASQAIFIDDVEENVRAAETYGLVAIQFKNTPHTIAALNELLEK